VGALRFGPMAASWHLRLLEGQLLAPRRVRARVQSGWLELSIRTRPSTRMTWHRSQVIGFFVSQAMPLLMLPY